MSYVERHTQGKAQAEPNGSRSQRTATMQCLIISQDAQRGDMLCRAAAEGGWEPVVIADARRAAAAVNRTLFRLVLVDTESASGTELEELHRFCEQFSESTGTLLVICGPQASASEEIWARQIGAWLYLPGVVDGAGVVSLCELATQVSGEMAARRQRSPLPS